jgi:hypothetical protein
MSLFGRRNKLTKIWLSGVAAVDRPAQEHGLLLVRKDEGSELNRVLVVKRLPQLLPHQNMPEGLVTGIVTVSTAHGSPHHDTQGDFIPNEELHSMAAQLPSKKAVFNPMHLKDPDTGKPIDAGYCTEAVVLDNRQQKALGISLPYEALIATFRVTDPTTLSRLEQGYCTGLSIEGKGQRTPVVKGRGRLQLFAKEETPMTDTEIKIHAARIVEAIETARAHRPEHLERRGDI